MTTSIRKAELIASIADLEWYIEGDQKYMSKYLRSLPRDEEHLAAARELIAEKRAQLQEMT